MSIILDLLLLLIIFSAVFLTYKKGFVKSVLDIASVIISIVLSNLLSPPLAEVYFPFFMNQINGNEGSLNCPEAVVKLFAHALAFVTIYVVLTIILKILTLIISGIFKLPVLKSLNRTLGLLLGIAKAFIFVFLFVSIVQLIVPFMTDTQSGFLNEEIIQNTFIFKYLYNIKWIKFLVN